MNSCGREEREGFGAQEKSATVFFPRLAPSPAALLCRQPAASGTVKLITLLLWPHRGFAGGSRAPEKCNRLHESKLAARMGKSLARKTGRWGNREKNKEKNSLCPNISSCTSVFYFPPFIFLVDFSMLLSFLSRVWLIFPSQGRDGLPMSAAACRQTDCNI